MRSGLWSRSLRYSNAPETSTAMRVTPPRLQWRTAVTLCGPGFPVCAASTVTPIANATTGFITLSGDVTHRAVRAHQLYNMTRPIRGGFQFDARGFHFRLRLYGRPGAIQTLLHLRHVILRFRVRRYAAVPGHCLLAGIVSRQRPGIIALVKIEQILQVLG